MANWVIALILYAYLGGSLYCTSLFNFINIMSQSIMFYPIMFIFALAILFIVASDDDDYFPMFPLVVLYLGVHDYYGHTQVLMTLLKNPFHTGVGIVSYVVIGVLWALLKFRLYVKNSHVEHYIIPDTIRFDATLNKTVKVPVTNEKILDVATRFVENNKYRIFIWIVYWPFNVIYTTLHDAVRELCEYLFGRMKRRLIAITVSQINRALESKKIKVEKNVDKSKSEIDIE